MGKEHTRIMKKKIYMAVAVVAVVGIAAWLLAGGEKKGGVTYNTAQVEKKDITTSVTATGTLEPVTSVTVGTQVSGIVSHLYVDYNSIVKKGQVIAELDKTNLISELASAKAQMSSAQSSLQYEKANYERYKTLYDKGLVSATDFESARLNYDKALQTVHTSAESVKKAETNLGYATITSPIDGIVLSKAVEEGQTVAASFSTPELFTIAQDLTKMQVIADIDEADIGDVREGERVSFTVDAFPDDTFTGRVTQVRQVATTESNVVTYEVVISAQNDDLKLKPGLTANVTIYTNEVSDVLSVSTKALQFTPNEKLLTENQSIEDCKGKDKVWVLQDNVFKAIPVTIGITNGILTEIKSGLTAGQTVVTDFTMGSDGEESGPSGNDNPFMPKPPSKNNKKN